MKYYQNEWHDIKFNTFWNNSRKDLASELFYEKFYINFFKKYKSYDDLDKEWIKRKNNIANWLLGEIDEKSKVLSVGSGIGIIEKYIFERDTKKIDLHLHDLSPIAQKWIKGIIPKEKIHTGENIPKGFDFVILTSLDYCFSNRDLINFLKRLKKTLNNNGKVIIISASYSGESKLKPVRFFREKINLLKEKLGIKETGQFWGWMRSREEYREIMIETFKSNYKDGFISVTNQKEVYWIMNTIKKSS